MKKIVKLSIIMLVITICMVGNTYAALSCEVNMKANKTEISKNDEFTVDVDVSSIQSERGIISLGATLEYDKSSLELVKMEGKNTWETPADGISYNSQNGKIAITRGGLGTENETVFTITFKAKETSKKNLVVTLKDITVADGTMPAKIERTYQNITVKDGTDNEAPDPGTDEDNNNNNTNTGTNTNTDKNNNINQGNTTINTINKNTVSNSGLPKAGDLTQVIFIVLIIAGVLGAGIFFVKIKKINEKIDKE